MPQHLHVHKVVLPKDAVVTKIKGVLCFSEASTCKPRPPKGSKKWNPPNMNPVLHWGTWGIIRGFHFLDPLGGLGRGLLCQSDVGGFPKIKAVYRGLYMDNGKDNGNYYFGCRVSQN